MSKEEWKSYYVYKQIDDATGLPKGFDTPSKKIEVYVESMITLGRTGQPFLPIEFAPEVTKKYNKANCEALGITVPDDYVAIEE